MKSLHSTDSAGPAGRDELVPGNASLLLSTYCLAVAASSMVSVLQLSPYYTAIAALLCAFHALIVGPEWKRYLPRAGANIVALLVFSFSALERWILGTPILISMGHFLMAVLFIKLYERNILNSFRLIQVGSVLLMTLAAASTDSFLFLPVFVACVVALVWNYIACEISRHREPAGSTFRRTGAQAWGVPLTSAAVFLATVILFIIFPRVGSRKLTWGQQNQAVIGYSDSLSLQDMGRLFENEEQVMKVRFFSPEADGTVRASPRLMRGRSLETYWEGSWYDCRRGRAWGAGRAGRLRSVLNFNPPRRYLLTDADVGTEYVRQEISLEPIDTGVLFGLYRPIRVRTEGQVSVQFDRFTHTLISRRRRFGPLNYEVLSLRPIVPREKLQQTATAYDVDSRRCFLDVPNTLRPELRDVVAQLEEEYNPRTDYERIMAVMDYLGGSDTFQYSLDVPASGIEDPVLAFLTRTRRGNCQHYASAMALLLRLWRIPTRLVIGFKGGSYLSGEQAWLFRQNDAHAWVEVCFSKYGWLPFDPTPGGSAMEGAGAEAPGEGIGLVTALKRMIGRLRTMWNRGVINYSHREQKEAILRALDAVRQLPSRAAAVARAAVRNVRSANPGFLMAFFSLVVIVVGMIYFAWPHLKRKLTATGGRRTATVWFYERLLTILGKRGIKRPENLTPREFADFAARKLSEHPRSTPGTIEAIQWITDRFCRVRFGSYTLDSSEKAELQALLARVRECPRVTS